MKIKAPNLDFVLRRHWPTFAERRPAEHCRQYKDFSQKTILGLLQDKGKSINKVPKFYTVDHGFDNFNLENFQSGIAHRKILEIHLWNGWVWELPRKSPGGIYEMYPMLIKSIDMLFRVVDFNRLNRGGHLPEMWIGCLEMIGLEWTLSDCYMVGRLCMEPRIITK